VGRGETPQNGEVEGTHAGSESVSLKKKKKTEGEEGGGAEILYSL